MVSPPEFLLDDPTGHILGLVKCVNRDGAPLLKVVVTPAPGDDHCAGEEQGGLDGDQVPAVHIFFNTYAAEKYHTHNIAPMFSKLNSINIQFLSNIAPAILP